MQRDIWLGKPKLHCDFEDKNTLKKLSVRGQRRADDPVSRMSTTGWVAQIGNHTVKSGSTLQSLTALSVGEVEFYAVVKGGHVGLSSRFTYMDHGISNEG